MYGMLFSIKSFVNKISPLDSKEGFLYYKTSKYTLHYFETPSGIKFILNTDNLAQNVRELLQRLYSQVCIFNNLLLNLYVQFSLKFLCTLCLLQVYIEYVVKNPLCQPNEPIQSELFKAKIDELIKKSPIFLSRSI